MSTDEEAANAASSLNETQFGGRSIQVNEARPKPHRGGGGGAGGGGGFGRKGGGSGGGGGYRRSEPRW